MPRFIFVYRYVTLNKYWLLKKKIIIIFALFSVSSLTWCTGSVVLLDVHVFCYFTIDFANNDPMHHLLFAMVYQRLCALRRVCFGRYTGGSVAFDTDSRAFPRW